MLATQIVRRSVPHPPNVVRMTVFRWNDRVPQHYLQEYNTRDSKGGPRLIGDEDMWKLHKGEVDHDLEQRPTLFLILALEM